MPILKIDGADVDVAQTGAGRELVLLHSLLTDRSAFDLVAPELARTRHLTLVNLPGYGVSTPAGEDVESYADRVAGLFGALKLPRQTDVLGNGFGGFIAVALAARHGARFDRLIVADALVSFPEPARVPLRNLAAKVAQEGMAGALDVAIRRMFPETFIAAHPGIVAERKRALERADPACFRTACVALARLDLAPVLKLIRNPTLVMAGALDQTTPPGLARELAAGIAGATFLEIPGCGHCPQIENPRAFVDAVNGFLPS
ncbi:MAG TPA: alpha/beta fold hydrolase [Burkholderiales bacterium]|nr:alpha/beta fold hydrolase [Burkholderiales bacterium]